jgi:hypothetical protein
MISAARQSRSQSSKSHFTAETPSSQRSEYFLIKNSLLCVLNPSALKIVADPSSGGSAVSFLQGGYNQYSHGKLAQTAKPKADESQEHDQ